MVLKGRDPFGGPSTMCVPEIGFMSSGMEVNAFTGWAISLDSTLIYLFSNETGFCIVAQAGLELEAVPPASAILGLHGCTVVHACSFIFLMLFNRRPVINKDRVNQSSLSFAISFLARVAAWELTHWQTRRGFLSTWTRCFCIPARFPTHFYTSSVGEGRTTLSISVCVLKQGLTV